MPNRRRRYHSERESPFFRLNSRRKLASLLFTSLTELQQLAQADGLYYQFKKPKSSGGFREISAPRDDLKAVQSRIADLLQRLAPPDYLFAPVSGRSYVDNAAVHIGASSIRLLDIEDFFPSCTANKVIWFFHKRMQCAPDVSSIIKSIVTNNGALPQGSPCSPILAYLCYIDMWEEIENVADGAGCALSVYADDMTISGGNVPETSIWDIKKILRKHGHRYKVDKERSKFGKPAEITGVILRADGLHAPNRQHKKIFDVRLALSKTKSAELKETLESQLRGREAQFRQITNGNSR